MKEIKAYIRVHMLDKVIRALEGEGFTDMTVIDVKAIRHGLREEDLEYSLELASRYMNVAKLAIVVRDRDVGSVVKIVRDHARTGHKGDGLIYVCPVEDGVHVRTGARGEEAVGSRGCERSVDSSLECARASSRALPGDLPIHPSAPDTSKKSAKPPKRLSDDPRLSSALS